MVWFESGYEFFESPCECDIESLGSITHGVIKLFDVTVIIFVGEKFILYYSASSRK